MQKNPNLASSATKFTLPMLETKVTTLQKFMSQQVIQPGLPLFELHVELTFCRDLIICLWSSAEADLKFTIKYKQVMGCLRLLLSRLMLIISVFEHGKRCCKEQYQFPDSYTGFAFTIQNQYQMLEVALAQPHPSPCFPLLAVINSVNSCIGVISCLLKCGGEGESEAQNYFSGGGDKAILHSSMMVENQLCLILQTIDIAQVKCFRTEKNVETKEFNMN